MPIRMVLHCKWSSKFNFSIKPNDEAKIYAHVHYYRYQLKILKELQKSARTDHTVAYNYFNASNALKRSVERYMTKTYRFGYERKNSLLKYGEA